MTILASAWVAGLVIVAVLVAVAPEIDFGE
jgi:hypothetical protein